MSSEAFELLPDELLLSEELSFEVSDPLPLEEVSSEAFELLPDELLLSEELSSEVSELLLEEVSSEVFELLSIELPDEVSELPLSEELSSEVSVLPLEEPLELGGSSGMSGSGPYGLIAPSTCLPPLTSSNSSALSSRIPAVLSSSVDGITAASPCVCFDIMSSCGGGETPICLGFNRLSRSPYRYYWI